MTSLGAIAASVGRRTSAIRGKLTRYRYVVSAADQLAISLLNFGLTFVLLRLLSAPEFGTVAVWMAASNLAIVVQGALVTTPLSIYAPAESDEAKRHQLEETLGSLNLLVIILAVITVVVVNLVTDAEWVPKDVLAWAAIPLYVGSDMSRQYYRISAFGRQDMMMLLIVDAPYLAVTSVCILVMLIWPSLAGLGGAFVSLMLGAFVGQFCGALRLAGRRIRLWRSGWIRPYRAIFGEVMWSLIGVVSTHLQERSYVYITTSLVGLAEVASLNAVAVLFRPAQILLTAWRRSALPEFARLFAEGRVAVVYRRIALASTVALSACLIWCAVLWVGWRIIEQHLFAGKYPEASLLLLPWAIAISLDAIEFIVSTALQAVREFRYLAWVTMLTAPITVVAIAGLTMWHGYTWTLYGLTIGNGLSAALVVSRLFRIRHRVGQSAATDSAH
ncbi:MAG TPA: lipopolysaccharide biosynthesis protein [Stellaceae bacterium]|jgi:O-antigen/teichoic acid export membrane protein|nr:lipopolysaccharide biosynthesis protein [Stellaceae bacterium]